MNQKSALLWYTIIMSNQADSYKKNILVLITHFGELTPPHEALQQHLRLYLFKFLKFGDFVDKVLRSIHQSLPFNAQYLFIF